MPSPLVIGLFSPHQTLGVLRRAAFFACACLCWLTACQPGTDATPAPLRVGLIRWAGFDVLQYALTEHLFTQQDVTVKLIMFVDTGDAQRAMQRDRIDILLSSSWALMNLPAGHEPLLPFLVIDQSRGADGIVAQAGIESLSELNGKRVSLETGTTDEVIWYEAQRDRTINIVPVPLSTAAAQQQLLSGDLDAAILFEPLLSESRDAIHGNILFSTASVDSLLFDVASARASTLSNRSAEIDAFVRAWFVLIDRYNANPAQVMQVMAKQLAVDEKSLAGQLLGVRLGDLQMNRNILLNGSHFHELVALRKVINADTTLPSTPIYRDALQHFMNPVIGPTR